MGNLADVTTMDFKPRPQIKKVSKSTYVLLKSGEVKEFMPSDGRNTRSLRKIMRDLRQTAQANFGGQDDKKLFVTLTYAENMQDEKRLMKDFDLFFKRLKYYLPDHKLDYLVVMEPQGRGAWHGHMLLKSDNDLFIHYADMERLWGHGATRTERLENIDNVGAYVVAYINNVEITDNNKDVLHVEDHDVIERNGKKYIKGERLKFYPDHMQIWRHSRGVKRPKSEAVYLGDVEADYEPSHMTREKIIELPQSVDGDNTITIVNTQHRKKKGGS